MGAEGGSVVEGLGVRWREAQGTRVSSGPWRVQQEPGLVSGEEKRGWGEWGQDEPSWTQLILRSQQQKQLPWQKQLWVMEPQGHCPCPAEHSPLAQPGQSSAALQARVIPAG